MKLGLQPNEVRLRRMKLGLRPNDAAPSGQLWSPYGTIENNQGELQIICSSPCVFSVSKKAAARRQRLLQFKTLCMIGNKISRSS